MLVTKADTLSLVDGPPTFNHTILMSLPGCLSVCFCNRHLLSNYMSISKTFENVTHCCSKKLDGAASTYDVAPLRCLLLLSKRGYVCVFVLKRMLPVEQARAGHGSLGA